MTPSLPTFSIALAISSPISLSPFAEIVPTWAISSDVLIIRALLFRFVTTESTAMVMPRLRSIAFIPAATDLQPSANIARVRTVAQVVPAPATSLVALATCFTRLAPTFLILLLNSTLFATVTPSFVTLGAPQLCSITTLRPLRTMVTLTASASSSTP
nr:Uncharacterised protein [Ipomoea batatas]GMD80438.1 Uncharacterised protein [Ipomoea batatas]